MIRRATIDAFVLGFLLSAATWLLTRTAEPALEWAGPADMAPDDPCFLDEECAP